MRMQRGGGGNGPGAYNISQSEGQSAKEKCLITQGDTHYIRRRKSTPSSNC